MNSRDHMVWESLPIPVFLLDQKDQIAAANPAAEGFLNIAARTLIGAPIWDMVMVDAPLDTAIERVRNDKSTLFVNDVEVGGGLRAPLQSNIQIAPLSRENGIILVVSPHELTGHSKHVQHAERGAKSAIGMAEMLAHEIKNPLAGIIGAAQLLSMNLESGDQEMTDLIVEEGRRIVKLLEQVEQFGDLRPPELRPVNIHDVLDRARRSAMLGFGAHMSFEEDFDPSLPLTAADGDQLLQVFLNLFKNAAEAAEPGAGVLRLKTYYERSLRLRRRDGSGSTVPLQIEVIDEGRGLPEAIANNIFDPFVSGKENGTGLGLALVSKIISDHHGWITVDSVPGRTCFKVSLPIAETKGET